MHGHINIKYFFIIIFFFFFFLFFIGLRSVQYNQCLLQNDCPYRSVFCFHPPSLDTYRLHIFSILIQSSNLSFCLLPFTIKRTHLIFSRMKVVLKVI